MPLVNSACIKGLHRVLNTIRISMLIDRFDFSPPTVMHPTDPSVRLLTDADYLVACSSSYIHSHPRTAHILPSRSVLSPSQPLLPPSQAAALPPPSLVTLRRDFFSSRDRQPATGAPVKKTRLVKPTPVKAVPPPWTNPQGYYMTSNGSMYYKSETGTVEERRSEDS